VAWRKRDAGVFAGGGAALPRRDGLGTLCETSRARAPCTQAEELLARNLANAQKSLEAVKAEVLSLRDRITTTEVLRKRARSVAALPQAS
jgi:hypothetical protein